jgi:hypothetical protein
MLVLGRAYCWLAIGYTGMPLFKRRIQRDEAFITRMAVGLRTFNAELAAMVKRVEGFA